MTSKRSNVLFIITFITIIIYGLLCEINWMDGWMDKLEYYYYYYLHARLLDGRPLLTSIDVYCLIGQDGIYTVSQKKRPPFCFGNNSVENWAIRLIFGTQHPVKI